MWVAIKSKRLASDESAKVILVQVTLVGLIRSVKESPTRVEYEIDDMTGPPLEVRQFVDTDVSLDFCFIFCVREKEIIHSLFIQEL